MKTLALDIETTKIPKHNPWCDNSYIVSVHASSCTYGTYSVIINHTESAPTDNYRQVIQGMVNAHDRIVGHNFKFDLMWLREVLGIDFSGKRLYCTQVAEYLINGQRGCGELSLADLSKKYGIPDKIDAVKGYWDSEYETDEVPLRILIPYGEQDVINTLAIFNEQAIKIQKLGLGKLVALQMELMRVISHITYNGMLLNLPLMDQYAKQNAERIDELTRELLSYLPTDFEWNIDSNDHLSVILFGGVVPYDGEEQVERVLKSGVVKSYTRKCTQYYPYAGLGFKAKDEWKVKKEGFYQTNVGVLSQLTTRSKKLKLFLELLNERSKLEKLNSTYFIGIAEKADTRGYIHPQLNQTVTKTGRLSSSNPNGQNIPRESSSPAKLPFISRYN